MTISLWVNQPSFRGRGEVTPPPVDTTAPTITSSNPSGSYPENTSLSGTLTADEVVTWSKTGTDAGVVTLNTSTGAWSLPTFDYETKQSYSWTFTATDPAGNASSQNISLTITDIDEVAPVITSANPSGSYPENSPVSGTLTANEAVTWSKSGTDAGLVTLNSSTGAWSIPAPDYETKQSYSWTFTATDGVGLTSSQNIALTITDVNEGGPPPTYAPESEAFFAASNLQDEPAKVDVDNFIKGLISNNLWSKMGRTHLLALPTTAGLTDLKYTTKKLTPINGPQFQANKGYTGDGVSAYLSFGEPLSAPAEFTSVSGHIGVYCNAQGAQTGLIHQLGRGGNNANHGRISGSSVVGASETFTIWDGTSTSGRVSTGSRTGYRLSTRVDSLKQFYFHGVKDRSGTVAASTATMTHNATLLRNDTAYCGDRICAVHTGSAFTDAEVTTFNSLLQTFLTARGAI